MTKILLLGKNGQLGWELQRSLAPLSELIALDRRNLMPLNGNLTNLKQLSQTIKNVAPTVIVNAAAYTAVDKAEVEHELAMQINAEAPKILAQEAAAIGAWLIHYSTDYVFDGTGSHFWQEKDKTGPLNHYGKSKLQGELAIQASGCKYLIFRSSWIYSLKGNNFIKTILRLAQQRQSLDIVADQFGAPAGADLLADVTAQALKMALRAPYLSGLYHIAPSGELSWYDYALYVIGKAKQLNHTFQCKTVNPILTNDYLTPAQRPLNSRLNTSKLVDTFSMFLPHWEIGVTRMLQEFLG